MSEVLFFTVELLPFMVDSVMCSPIPYEDGWFLPLGWESVLEEKGVEFNLMEIGI
jgi:hypothetical protein